MARVQMIASNWSGQWFLPSDVLDLLAKHIYPMRLLQNIDDSQQLEADWSDKEREHFYFWRRKWSILQREGSDCEGYQSLLCYDKAGQCLVAFQSRKVWLLGIVSYDKHRNRRGRRNARELAYSTICKDVFERVKESNL